MGSKEYKQLKPLLIIVGALCGFFIVLQFRSFKEVENIVRDSNANNIFREIQVLKLTNDELKQEIVELTLELENLTDGRSFLESIRTALEKNRIIAGLTTVQGPGIMMTLDKKIDTSWLVDTQNELWTAGAEAIAVNGIRLSPYTKGFENFNGQIYLNKVPIRVPYKIEAIGNADVLVKILVQQGSISARISNVYPGIKINVSQIDSITMNAVR
ncbi:MAG: DUF881 domain-containing protein [Candidatus Peregrinibacteria bacterium]|nr:DUF881 domain-containing protein [Candidatus Peregrinibacteria bacterium]MDZ4245162.1 DUF881 domain-containing protein [Candidatus Gracilibacteria bacterium]